MMYQLLLALDKLFNELTWLALSAWIWAMLYMALTPWVHAFPVSFLIATYLFIGRFMWIFARTPLKVPPV